MKEYNHLSHSSKSKIEEKKHETIMMCNRSWGVETFKCLLFSHPFAKFTVFESGFVKLFLLGTSYAQLLKSDQFIRAET